MRLQLSTFRFFQISNNHNLKPMKIIFALAFAVLFTVSATFAQDLPYQKVMKREIEKVINADSVSQLQNSANAFARIAELNPNEWQPYYYGSLAYTFQGLKASLTLDQKDNALAKANELAKKAAALSPKNGEIVSLQGFILMAKLNADPSNRGQSLSGQVMSIYGMSLGIDSQNPRTLALSAQMEYGLAQFFGSGTEKACGLAKQSLAIFESQDETALKAAIQPSWGKNMAASLVKKCK
jgi:hypothetical protein